MAELQQKVSLIAAVVISAMHSGYRRANCAFEPGENSLEVTEAQFQEIEHDNNLLIKIAEPVTSEDSKGLLDDELLGDGVVMPKESLENGGLGDDTLDVSAAPFLLQDWIIAIDELNAIEKLIKKPTCEQLAISVEGSNAKIKPSAVERDDAWAWYQENVVIVSANANASETADNA